MTYRDNKLDIKDLEVLNNLPNLRERINKNMQNIDNYTINQRELNSSVNSLNSSNNALRAIAHSKGKTRRVNVEDCIDIKNIVKQSVEGIHGIIEADILVKNNPSVSSSICNLNSSKEKIAINKNLKTKNLNNGNNTKFEPIEEENNIQNNDYTSNFLYNASDVNKTPGINGKKGKITKDKKEPGLNLNNLNILSNRIVSTINNQKDLHLNTLNIEKTHKHPIEEKSFVNKQKISNNPNISINQNLNNINITKKITINQNPPIKNLKRNSYQNNQVNISSNLTYQNTTITDVSSSNNFVNAVNSNRINNKNLKPTKEKTVNKNNYLYDNSLVQIENQTIFSNDNNILEFNKKEKSQSINNKNNLNLIKNKIGIKISPITNFNNLKSKSRMKTSNKRYDNVSENEKTFNVVNFQDEGIDLSSLNTNTEHNNIFSKKLPRDSKSPNIRNYKTKRNINSISLNDNNDKHDNILFYLENDLTESQTNSRKIKNFNNQNNFISIF